MRGNVLPLLSPHWHIQPVRVTGEPLALRLATYGRINSCTLEIVLQTPGGQVRYQRMIDASTLIDNAFFFITPHVQPLAEGEALLLCLRSCNAGPDNHIGIWRERGVGPCFTIQRDLRLLEGERIAMLGGGFALGYQQESLGLAYERRWRVDPRTPPQRILFLMRDAGAETREGVVAEEAAILRDLPVKLCFAGQNWAQEQPDLVLLSPKLGDAEARGEALLAHRLGVPVLQIVGEGAAMPARHADGMMTLEHLRVIPSDRLAAEVAASLAGVVPSICVLVSLSGQVKDHADWVKALVKQSYAGKVHLIFVGRAADRPLQDVIGRIIAHSPPAQCMSLTFLFDDASDLASAWSRAAEAAEGDLLLLADMRVLPAPTMLQAHVDGHSYQDCAASMGSLCLEGESASAVKLSAGSAERFIHARAGNLCLRRNVETVAILKRVASLDLPLEWQALLIGFFLYEAGERIKFIENAQASPRDPHQLSALFTKDGAIAERINRDVPGFAAASCNWQADYILPQDVPPPRPALHPPKAGRALRILTYRWHVPHQYELYKLPHQFDLLTGLGSPISEGWDFGLRPMPRNARFITPDTFREEDYDLAILHFDENVLSPEHTNGHLGAEWGANFRWFVENLRLPKVAICHGTPQFYGQYTPGYAGDDLMQVIEPSRQKMVDYLGDIEVVCNSHQARAEWGFRKSRVIWHGFDPAEFAPARYEKGILSPLGPLVTSRPHYRGYYLYQQVFNDAFPREFLPETLKVPDPHIDYADNQFAYGKYNNYINKLRSYSVYFNPTLRSPMPRARAEPMMCGVVSVNAHNHDVDLFIKNGINGFYSNDADELREHLLFLVKNPGIARKMGAESRKTAMELFNNARYLSEWAALIRGVV